MTPRKKDVEPLDRERILAAAMRIIDAEGLDALSMRKLGAELGVNPMAAYYHVPNKAALYDLVLEAVMAGVDVGTIDPAAALDEQLKQAGRAYRAAILRHPRAIPVLATRSLRTAAVLRPVEPMLGIFYAAGLSPDEAMAAVDVLAQFILGGAVGYYHHTFDEEAADDQREFEDLDPAEFPNTTRMITEARYLGPDGEFEFGLTVVISGLLACHGHLDGEES
ncbi:MAG TPA: TetR/AcrR family transcriptional regulator C-terminal domain-containing protein [Thermoleophilia bacterium]|nr:TetR/AcrR family transcriptional regulator C-terminal domain-containing protein [Thermoleophilia bacterium]